MDPVEHAMRAHLEAMAAERDMWAVKAGDAERNLLRHLNLSNMSGAITLRARYAAAVESHNRFATLVARCFP